MAASSSPLTSEEDVLIQNGDIEIETVDEETFDILDDATDLGTLAFGKLHPLLLEPPDYWSI